MSKNGKEKAQDKIVAEALAQLQENERRAMAAGAPFNPQTMMRRAMGYPTEQTAFSIGGSLVEAVEANFGAKAWDVVRNTARVQEMHRQNLPDDYPVPPQGAILLLIYGMELGREIGKREAVA